MAAKNPTPAFVFGDLRLPARFWLKVQIDPATGCWEWIGTKGSPGYGEFYLGCKKMGTLRKVLAHRYAYLMLVGQVPDGLQLDHFRCDLRRCVHPGHVRPVTIRENVLRGTGITSRQAASECCPLGHPYDYMNVRGDRCCRECTRRSDRRHAEKRRLTSGGTSLE